MNIAVASDHRGFAKKQKLIICLQQREYQVIDEGCHSTERCDYPYYAQIVAQKVRDKKIDVGILLCGSGVGMSIAANRFRNVYAALVWNQETARLSKEHDNANILVIPADFVTDVDILVIVQAWLDAQFLKGRYQERLIQIDSQM